MVTVVGLGKRLCHLRVTVNPGGVSRLGLSGLEMYFTLKPTGISKIAQLKKMVTHGELGKDGSNAEGRGEEKKGSPAFTFPPPLIYMYVQKSRPFLALQFPSYWGIIWY
jgi:hypothetical protein